MSLTSAAFWPCFRRATFEVDEIDSRPRRRNVLGAWTSSVVKSCVVDVRGGVVLP